jgi:hypothetical protein
MVPNASKPKSTMMKGMIVATNLSEKDVDLVKDKQNIRKVQAEAYETTWILSFNNPFIIFVAQRLVTRRLVVLPPRSGAFLVQEFEVSTTRCLRLLPIV